MQNSEISVDNEFLLSLIVDIIIGVQKIIHIKQ